VLTHDEARAILAQVRPIHRASTIAGPKQDAADPAVSGEPHRATSLGPQARHCPCCKTGHLEHVRKLYPRQVRGP
jgi:hypothetical protein